MGAGGVAVVTPHEPDTRSFAVEPQAGTWSQPIPGELVVEPGTRLELSFDIEVVRGRVTVVDATEVPVGCVLVRHLRTNGGSTVSTDEHGVLELVLPPSTTTSRCTRTPRRRTTREPCRRRPPSNGRATARHEPLLVLE